MDSIIGDDEEVVALTQNPSKLQAIRDLITTCPGRDKNDHHRGDDRGDKQQQQQQQHQQGHHCAGAIFINHQLWNRLVKRRQN